MMVNHHPFKSSRFDPYHGDQGEAPFQDVIDYARSRGGMVFWAHPESNYSKNGVEMGPVKLMTEHYPDRINPIGELHRICRYIRRQHNGHKGRHALGSGFNGLLQG